MTLDYFVEVMELFKDMEKMKEKHNEVIFPLSAIAGYYAGRKFIDEKDIQAILKVEIKILDGYEKNKK